MSRGRRGYQGFSLIEMSVALAIVSVLAMGALPLLRAEQQRARESDLRQALTQMRRAIDEYKRAADEGRIAKAGDASGYPENLEVLVRGVQRIGVPRPEWLYFLRKIPKDPFAPETASGDAGAAIWATRSSASPPDAPAPGRDVFDVFSRSTAVGSNGIPYNQW